MRNRTSHQQATKALEDLKGFWPGDDSDWHKVAVGLCAPIDFFDSANTPEAAAMAAVLLRAADYDNHLDDSEGDPADLLSGQCEDALALLATFPSN